MANLVFLIALVFIGTCYSDIATEVLNAMDLKVDPCNDFFAYACGGWIKNSTLPPSKARLSKSFSAVEDGNVKVLQEIVNDASTGKINTLYKACMNDDSIERVGFQPILKYVNHFPQNLRELLRASGHLYKEAGIRSVLSFSAQIDAKQPERVGAQFDQGDLGLPDPSYYFSQSEGAVKLRKQYLDHITATFKLTGTAIFKDHVAAAKLAFELETVLANFTLSAEELFDPFLTYHKYSHDQFVKIFPEVFSFLAPLNVHHSPKGTFVVTVPTFFSNLTKTLPSYVANYRPYLAWQVLRQKSSVLSKAFRDQHFDFYKRTLAGQSQPEPRWRECINQVDRTLGELLGHYFVQKAFPEKSREATVKLLEGIYAAFKLNVNRIDWMDSVTRARALTKLSQVTHLIGSPVNYDKYTSVVISHDFFQNTINGIHYQVLKNLKNIDKPSNETVKFNWEMTASTVNAYYEPTKNQMVFPAGILQYPFFHSDYPIEMQAGSIGMVMGHELTHGFDSQGRLYDGTGKLNNWWEPSTSKLFDQKVECVIDQYNKFEIIPGVFVNGKLTQGENIADMGGIKNAFAIAEAILGRDLNKPSIIPQLTRAQLAFVSFGQIWCEIASDAHYILRVKTDPHSPGKFRIMGSLINLPRFSEIFKCPVGSVMNPKKRCEVW